MLAFAHNSTGANSHGEIDYSISKRKSSGTEPESARRGKPGRSGLNLFPDQLQKSLLLLGPVEMWAKRAFPHLPSVLGKRGKRSGRAGAIVHISIGQRLSALPVARYPIAGLLVHPCRSALAAIG